MDKNLYLQRIDNDIAKRMVIKNHYSHTIAFGISLSLGVFQKTTRPHILLVDETEDELMGCIVYSVPVGAQVHKGISPEIKAQDEVMELTRLWIDDKLGKNTESWVISRSFDYVKKLYPKVKVLISYADSAQRHLGRIYQATNWIYQGSFDTVQYLYSLDKGKTWRHNKGLRNVYHATTHEELLSVLPRPLWVKLASAKHRYLMPLGNRIEKRKISSSLVHPTYPYPKDDSLKSEEIIKYEA